MFAGSGWPVESGSEEPASGDKVIAPGCASGEDPEDHKRKFKNSIQDGTKFCLSMSKTPSDDVPESLYKLRIRQSEQLKTALEMYEMEFHQKISMPNIKH